MFLADLHIHSTFSDGRLSIPELVDLYGQKGFGAIAITDHLCENQSILGKAANALKRTLNEATFPLYMEILRSEAERAMKTYGMVIIPGYELTKNSISNHRSAHIVALGVNKFMWANGDVLDLARKVRAQGALAIAAHPVSTRKAEKQTYHLWDRRFELAKEFDAWEVASGPFIFTEVRDSGLPMVASSDLHVRSQLTSWKTRFDCEKSPEAIMEAIRKQDLDFVFYEEEVSHDGMDFRSDARDLGFSDRVNHLGNSTTAESLRDTADAS